MNFFSQPCLALPESRKLKAKRGHAKANTHNSKPHSHFHTFILSHLSTIQHPRKYASRECGEKLKIQNRDALTLPPSSLNPLIPRGLSAAFSLTEVVIAMGVAAVAFTSIIALFPLGLNMSKDSYEETQAALIAQTILSDLKDQQVGSKNLRYDVKKGSPYSYKLIQIAGNVDPQMVSNNYLGIDLRLRTEQNVYLAYDAKSRSDTDATSQPIMLRPSAGTNTIPDWYDGSKPSNGLAAVAKVTFVPTFTITSTNSTTGVIRVDISIETPGSAKPENRTVRLYTGAVVP
jgi:Tfp pilus assembly protein PilV